MSHISTILESDQVKTFLEQNAEVLQEAENQIQGFPKILKSFILDHVQEFIGESKEDFVKNIRVFSEVATAQYIQEVSALTSRAMTQQEALHESAITDYL